MTLETRTQYASNPTDSFLPSPPFESKSQSIILKVMEDISFLEERIERMQRLQQPNATVLKTYRNMLDSRESVLQWLQENKDELEDEYSNCG